MSAESRDDRVRKVLFDREPKLQLDELPTHLVAIIVGAMLHEQLIDVVNHRMPDTDEAKRFIIKMSYSNLIRFAHALGVISANLAQILVCVGEVRNHFAHKSAPNEEEPKLKQSLQKLEDLYLLRYVEYEAQGRLDASEIQLMIEEMKKVEVDKDYARALLIDLLEELRGSLAIVLWGVEGLDRIQPVDILSVSHLVTIK